jgi:hypothetical protein
LAEVVLVLGGAKWAAAVARADLFTQTIYLFDLDALIQLQLVLEAPIMPRIPIIMEQILVFVM